MLMYLLYWVVIALLYTPSVYTMCKEYHKGDYTDILNSFVAALGWPYVACCAVVWWVEAIYCEIKGD